MVSAVCQEAEANGYTLDADSEDQLTAIRENLESSAANYGYDDADRIVQDAFGANTTLDAYMEFVRKSMIASGYLNAKVEQIECTDEQLSDYYDEHADDYLCAGHREGRHAHDQRPPHSHHPVRAVMKTANTPRKHGPLRKRRLNASC